MIYAAAKQFMDLLADCPNFQSWVSANNTAGAMDYIHLYRSDEATDTGQTKCAIIDNDVNLSLTRRASGTGLCAFSRNDGLRFALMQDYTAHNQSNAINFINTVDGILNDLLNLSGTSTQEFKIHTLNQVEPLGIQKHEDPFRWINGDRLGYQLHFAVGRTTG